jgi:hypothetical protein
MKNRDIKEIYKTLYGNQVRMSDALSKVQSILSDVCIFMQVAMERDPKLVEDINARIKAAKSNVCPEDRPESTITDLANQSTEGAGVDAVPADADQGARLGPDDPAGARVGGDDSAPADHA